MGRGILPISKQECFLLKREAKPTAKCCWDRGSSSEAATWPHPWPCSGFPHFQGHHRAESKLQRSRPSRTSGKEPRGVAVASSGSRCPTLALPRLPASQRGTPGRRATPTRLAASEGREHRGATAHLGPGRCAQAREASTRVRVPKAATTPDECPRRGPRPPEPASPRSAARHSHFGCSSSGGGNQPRVGGLVCRATEAVTGGAAVTSRAGAGQEPRSSWPQRARRKWAGPRRDARAVTARLTRVGGARARRGRSGPG